MEHTPGPWRVFDRYDPLVIATDSDGMKIAYMSDRGPRGTSNVQANAQLIAAAPDLLEIVKSHVLAWDDNYGGEPAYFKAMWDLIPKARATIAEATNG